MFSRQHWLNLCFILSALLGVWMGVASGQDLSIQLIPQYPVIGVSVTLRVTNIASGNIRSVSWYKGEKTSLRNQILLYIFPGSDPQQINRPMYHRRITAFPNGSLLISSLERTDGGDYTVQVQTDTAHQEDYVTLTVYDFVGKPTITASLSASKENDTVTLTCTAANADKIVWSRNGSSLPSSASLSSDYRTVTFSRITRMDSGNYRCEAENRVSKESSAPYTLAVAFGPEDARIAVQVKGKSSILFQCYADSVPPASYNWTVPWNDLNIKQDKLRVDYRKPENQGTYTCVMTNPITQRTTACSVYLVPFEELSPNAGTLTGIVLGTGILIGLVVVVTTYIWTHRKKRSGDLQSTVNNKNSTNEDEEYENVNALQLSQNETTMPGNQMRPGQESVYQELTHKTGSIYNTMAGAAGKH